MQTIDVKSIPLLQNTIKQLKYKANLPLPELLSIEQTLKHMAIEGLGELRAVMSPHLPQSLEVELFKNMSPYLDTEDMYLDNDINSFNQKDKTDCLTLKFKSAKK